MGRRFKSGPRYSPKALQPKLLRLPLDGRECGRNPLKAGSTTGFERLLMPRARKSVPSYRHHKPTGQAVCTITGPDGRPHDVYLGKYNSEASREAYERVLAELRAGRVVKSAPSGTSVAELLLAFKIHAEQRYRDPTTGKPNSTLITIVRTVKVVRELYAHTPTDQFLAPQLETVQAELVRLGLARSEVNRRTKWVRKMFRWGVRQGLVPAHIAAVLAEVEMLRPGQSAAPDRPPVRPADPAAVEATLPYLSAPLRAVVQLLRLTGARPSEILNARPRDVERSEEVWILRLPRHKTAWKIGRARVVHLGPAAQTILAPWLDGADSDAFIFSPRRAVQLKLVERAAKRMTPRHASHMARNAAKRKSVRKREAGERYEAHALTVAVRRACDRAFPPPAALAKRSGETEAEWKTRLTPDDRRELIRWRKSHRWTPYQLRHLRAVELRSRYGLEHVRVVLGHTALAMSQHYSEEADKALAARAAKEIG